MGTLQAHGQVIVCELGRAQQMDSEDMEALKCRLKDSEAKAAKLKSVLVSLTAKSAAVQSLCQKLQSQHESDVATLESYKQREILLLKRCQDAEAQIQRVGAVGRATLKGASNPPNLVQMDAIRELQQDLANKGQAAGSGDDRIMQSAVSMCEGALGILKAAMGGAWPGNQSNAEHRGDGFNGNQQNSPSSPEACRGEHDEIDFVGDADKAAMAARSQANKRPFSGLQGTTIPEKTPSKRLRIDQTELGMQLCTRKPEVMGGGAVALNIAQEWLAKLSSAALTQDEVDEIAAGLLVAVEDTRLCPIQCLTACIALAVSHCAHGGGSLSVELWDNDTDQAEQDGGEGLNVEDLLFSRVWYDSDHRSKRCLTNILACVASLDRQASQRDKHLSRAFSQAVEAELQQILLADHRQRGRAYDCEDCALITSLIVLHRMRGNIEAARTLLLDILIGMAGNPELALPCLAASLSAWPDLMKGASPNSRCAQRELFQEGLQALCQGVVNDSHEQSRSRSTSTESVSHSTIPGALQKGLSTSARYILRLGERLWDWQSPSGGVAHCATKALDDAWKMHCCKGGTLPGAEGPSDFRAAMRVSIRLSSSLHNLEWTCHEVVQRRILPCLEAETAICCSNLQISFDKILHELVDLCCLFRTSQHKMGLPLHNLWLDVLTLQACPLSAQCRLQKLLA